MIIIVSDTGPIVHLKGAGLLELLGEIGDIYIPKMVDIEITIPSFYYEVRTETENANKFEHIRHINTMLGLYVPILTISYELLFGSK